MNRVVARFTDGQVVKGETSDFVTTKDLFHVSLAAATPGSKPVQVQVKDLKALFFVKDLVGDPKHAERKEFDLSHPPIGRRIKVTFKDGEVLVGTTQGYQPGRAGFFLIPADTGSNIERCYVVSTATQEVVFL